MEGQGKRKETTSLFFSLFLEDNVLDRVSIPRTAQGREKYGELKREGETSKRHDEIVLMLKTLK